MDLFVNAETEELVATLVANAPVAAAILDSELRYRWVNDALCAMNGRSAAEHLGHTPREMLGALGEELEQVLRRALREDVPVVNYRFSGRAGRDGRYWRMGSYYPLRNESGEVIAVGAIITDITEHERRAAREQRFQVALVRVAQAVAAHGESREMFSVVAREAAGVLNLDGAVIARFQPEGVSLEGRWGSVPVLAEPGEVLPASMTPLTEQVRRTGHPQRMTSDQPDAMGFRSRVAAPITVEGVLWGAVKAGTPEKQELIEDAEERLAHFAGLVGLAVTNAAVQRRLIEEAQRDPLTGLWNRRAFQERLESEAERARRHEGSFSLILFDIDEFKRINDTLGHDRGDIVLVETARRLAGEVRREDLLARVGGEEFAWILTDINGVDAWLAADRARQAIADELFDQVGRVTLSAGVASFDEAGSTDELFRQADRALYDAKRRGRNRSVHHADATNSGRGAPSRQGIEHARAAERAHELSALRALARAIDAKDRATFHHSERVARLAQALARALGWPQERALALRDAGLLHDVGKIGIPDQILLKPGPLTDEEYEQIKTHAHLGWQIVRDAISPEQADWILHHHERWDGAGYPDGLAGDEIPDGAQLLAVADAWDAMTVARPHGAPLSPAEALEECVRRAGRQFAPAVVEALRTLEQAAVHR